MTRVAYVDESYTRAGDAVLAAVVMERDAARTRAQALARFDDNGEGFHCNRESSARQAAFVAAAIGPDVAHLAVFRGRFTNRIEEVRDAALASLLHQLGTEGVTEVTLDTRRNARRADAERANRADRTTLAHLQSVQPEHHLLRRMQLRFGDDRRHPELWMADTAAWHVRRSIEINDPAPLRLYTPGGPFRLLEARISPGRHVLEGSRGVQPHLNHLAARAVGDPVLIAQFEQTVRRLPPHLQHFPGTGGSISIRPRHLTLPDGPTVHDAFTAQLGPNSLRLH